MADWSPAAYLKFEDERTRPARDLLAQVPLERAQRAYDVGCGPGNSTALIAERHPNAEIIGLDNSPAMLREAALRLPQVRFEYADARSWTPAPGADLVFANATYQWIENHEAQLAAVLGALGAGAVLAVQMPDNLCEPTHVLMSETARELGVADKARAPLAPAERYYDALKGEAARVEIWTTAYYHVLKDAAAIVEWVRATGLRPFLDPLSPQARENFRALYTDKIARAYRPACDGAVLLRFPRLFIIAQR